MTTAQQNLTKAAELERRADMLDSALLAPSLKSQTLREQAAKLRQCCPSCGLAQNLAGHKARERGMCWC